MKKFTLFAFAASLLYGCQECPDCNEQFPLATPVLDPARPISTEEQAGISARIDSLLAAPQTPKPLTDCNHNP